MKRFLIEVLLTGVLAALVLAGALFFVPNNKIPDNSLFASIDKHRRLSSLESPKVVLVGGSNLPFGIKSSLIEDSLGMPVVNMGLHAGLGLNYILSEVEKDIHEGDIVVVSLEYHHFLSKTMYNGEDVLAALLFDVNRDCLQYVKPAQWLALLPNLCLYASKKIINITPKATDEFEALFSRESFNEYGDEVAHYGRPSTIHSGEQPALSGEVYGRATERLARFRDYVEAQGALFVLVACPYPEAQYSQDNEVIDGIVAKVAGKGMPFGIVPEDCLFPDSLMFNSLFHLSESGADARTLQLINHFTNH